MYCHVFFTYHYTQGHCLKREWGAEDGLAIDRLANKELGDVICRQA